MTEIKTRYTGILCDELPSSGMFCKLIFMVYWHEWKSMAAWNEGECLKKQSSKLYSFRNHLSNVEPKRAKTPL